ncbi:MAG: YgiT-type zinc finger protein [Acidimicrobiia bacterium]|nr:YgiT-type zinc finger protein [Acidimicrobiia bacterium]
MPCPRCEGAAIATTVRTAIWPTDDSLVVVEDIPARVCNQCMEQFYDEDVSDALRVLMERGFPSTEAKKLISVPVFSLEGRVRKRAAVSEDTYLD